MSRHDLKNERQAEEYPAPPPAQGGEKISCLPDTNQRVGRRARTAKACSQSAALSALQQNGEDKNNAIDDEQS
jgi:hypothetical protein